MATILFVTKENSCYLYINGHFLKRMKDFVLLADTAIDAFKKLLWHQFSMAHKIYDKPKETRHCKKPKILQTSSGIMIIKLSIQRLRQWWKVTKS